MRKRVLWLLALAFSAACTEAGFRTAQLNASIGTPTRIAGVGNLAEPQFAASGGLFLTITDDGQPSLVFVVTATTLQADTVSAGTPPSGAPDLALFPDDDSSGGSVDGSRRVAVFLSQASNLLALGSGVPFFRDSTQAFLKDLDTGENFLVSADANGFPADDDVTAVVISGNARFVVFATRATNLVQPVNPSLVPNGASQIYVLDLFTGLLQLVSMNAAGRPGAGDSTDPVITPDGRFVVFRSVAADLVPNDMNLTADVFLFDRSLRTMARLSVNAAGAEQFADAREPAVSQNGMIVAFTAVDVNTMGPRQVYVNDRGAGTVTNVSHGGLAGPGDADSSSPSVSGNGRFVAFDSAATNLLSNDVEGFTDVFVFDRNVQVLARVSLNTAGTMGGNADSSDPTLSFDGAFIGYLSEATDVAAADANRPSSVANGLKDLILGPNPLSP